MKFAISVRETRCRTVIVDADTYREAKRKVKEAYKFGDIYLDEDNSEIDVNYKNDTDNYIEVFGKEDFDKMETDIK